MRLLLARAATLVLAAGMLALLVVHAGMTGCATDGAVRAGPQSQSLGNATTPLAPAPSPAPQPTAPVTTAAAPSPPPVALPPGKYLPATKAAPVFYPSSDTVYAQPPKQQQAKP